MKLETERDFQDQIWYFTGTRILPKVLDLKTEYFEDKMGHNLSCWLGSQSQSQWFCLKYFAKFNRKRSIVSIFIVPPCATYVDLIA